MSELTENQADIIKSFAIFYLLLIANYIGGSLFTCLQINTIKNPIKYIIEYNSFSIGGVNSNLPVLDRRVTEKKNNKKALNNCIVLWVVIVLICKQVNKLFPI